MTTIDVLWTGGLDSTFLVASLCAHEDIAVQPYYIIDEARRSTEQELKAIRTITDALRLHPATRGMEKPQEWQSLHDMGYGEIAAMTWFCHRPVCGLPVRALLTLPRCTERGYGLPCTRARTHPRHLTHIVRHNQSIYLFEKEFVLTDGPHFE